MDTTTKIVKDNAVIRTSRNLRGLTDYASVSPVVRVTSCPVRNVSGAIRVTYKDGAEGYGNFRSYHVMIDWIRNRRTWRAAKHDMIGPDMGYLTKPGIIAGGKA